MENIEILAVKVRKAAENLKKFTNENHKLKLEVEYLRKENERNRSIVSEYAALKRNAKETVSRVERIMKKIDTVKVS
jgi:regulator of replication initiation timing